MKKPLLFFLLISFCLTPNARALVGVGHMTKYLGAYTDDTKGGHESLLSPWPYLSVHEYFNVSGKFFFIPEFGVTLKKSSYGDKEASNANGGEASKRQLIFILANFSYMAGNGTHLRFGAGIFMTKISGDGGEVTRNNGASTATYFLPSESITSYNSTLNLGIEQFIMPKIAVKLETYAWNILDSTSRRFNFALALNLYN